MVHLDVVTQTKGTTSAVVNCSNPNSGNWDYTITLSRPGSPDKTCTRSSSGSAPATVSCEFTGLDEGADNYNATCAAVATGSPSSPAPPAAWAPLDLV